MPYEIKATSDTPALIIYLLDMSSSMGEMYNGEPKIDIVSQIVRMIAREMVQRSMKGTRPAARYRVAIIAYNNEVHDIFQGAIPIDKFMQQGIPVMKPSGRTATALAFQAAEELLKKEWHNIYSGRPAPLICHMTDGEYTEDDPLPIARRIMQMETRDGYVLIENIFWDSQALPNPVDPYRWPGIASESQLASDTAKHLFRMSSPIPDSYRELFADRGYNISPNARLFFPGDTPEIVEAGFVMSTMTPTH
jgi:uncharacterized protein YegL